MEPTYLNGEVVLIKQTGFDYDGAVYAVDWDGQTYIKKVYREERWATFSFSSINVMVISSHPMRKILELLVKL